MFEVMRVSCGFRRTRPVDIEQSFESNTRSTTRRGSRRSRGGRVMGCVQQAVLEFDEEVQAPWRPRLVVVARTRTTRRRPAPARASVPPEPVAGGRLPSAGRPAAAPVSPARRPVAPRPEGRVAGPDAGRRTRPASPPGPVPCAAVPARARRAGVRLTRRARRLAVVMALAAGVALGSWLGPLIAGRRGPTCGSPGRAASSSSPATRCGRSPRRWTAGATCGPWSTRSRRLNGLDGRRAGARPGAASSRELRRVARQGPQVRGESPTRAHRPARPRRAWGTGPAGPPRQ